MGIDGLLAAMKPEMKFGHLSNFTGKVAAIDAMSWLYKGAFSCAMELAQKKPVATYLLFTYKMIMLLKKWQVKPIFCIDGRTLGAKERTNRKRTERKHTETDKAQKLLEEGNEEGARKAYTRAIKITKKMIYKFVDMLRALQVEYIISPYEADAEITYLINHGIADIAISEDSDMIAYNCPITLFKLGAHGECEYVDLNQLRERRRNKEKLANDHLNTLFKLSEENFVYVCILAGCDYLPSIKGIGLKKGLDYFERFGNVDSIIRRLRVEPKFMGRVPDNYEEMVKKVSMIFRYQLVYDPNTQSITTLNPRENLMQFLREYKYFVGDLIADIEDFARGKIHCKTLEKRQFEEFNFKELMGINIQEPGKPTMQDIIDKTIAEMKFTEKKNKPGKVTKEEKSGKASSTKTESTKPSASKEPINLDDSDFDPDFYDTLFEIEEEERKEREKRESKGSSGKSSKKKENQPIDPEIDFLFQICNEYKANELGEAVEIKKSKTGLSFFTPDLDSPEPVINIAPTVIKGIQDDQRFDSFKKLKGTSKNTKGSEFSKSPNQSLSVSPISNKDKESMDFFIKNPKKIEFETDYFDKQVGKKSLSSTVMSTPIKDQGVKKMKLNDAPSLVNSGQGKISIFLQKNKH